MKEVRLYLYGEVSLSIHVRSSVSLPPLGHESVVTLQGFDECWDWDKEAGNQFAGYMERELRVQWGSVVAVTITEEMEHEEG